MKDDFIVKFNFWQIKSVGQLRFKRNSKYQFQISTEMEFKKMRENYFELCS